MSYEICYSKNFIKTSKGYLMLVLSGSNNTYECRARRDRREREWTIYYCQKFTRFVSEQEVLDFISQDEHYDFCVCNGKNVYGTKAVIDFYKSGFRNARTIEEWLEHGRFVYTDGHKSRLYGGLELCLIHRGDEWYKDNYINVKTTQELEEAIEKLAPYHNAKDTWLHIGFCSNEKVVYTAEKKAIEGQCVLKLKRGSDDYLTAENKIVTGIENAHVFDTYEEAQDFYNNKTYYACKIVKYDLKRMGGKNYVIRVDDRGYFVKFSKYGYRYTCYLQKETARMTEKKALENIAKLKAIFGEERHFEAVRLGA